MIVNRRPAALATVEYPFEPVQPLPRVAGRIAFGVRLRSRHHPEAADGQAGLAAVAVAGGPERHPGSRFVPAFPQDSAFGRAEPAESGCRRGWRP